eukprot:6013057-Karenia_brevis.AAC.1
MDFPEPAGVYGATTVFENNEHVSICEDEPVFPVFCGIGMGWTWALWMVHTTVTSLAAKAMDGDFS